MIRQDSYTVAFATAAPPADHCDPHFDADGDCQCFCLQCDSPRSTDFATFIESDCICRDCWCNKDGEPS
jgi:hypothetical protein